jgi:hypothetical protein
MERDGDKAGLQGTLPRCLTVMCAATMTVPSEMKYRHTLMKTPFFKQYCIGIAYGNSGLMKNNNSSRFEYGKIVLTHEVLADSLIDVVVRPRWEAIKRKPNLY